MATSCRVNAQQAYVTFFCKKLMLWTIFEEVKNAYCFQNAETTDYCNLPSTIYHEIKDNPNRKGVNNHTCIDIFEKFKFLQLASIANLSPSNHIVFLLNFVPVIHHCNGNAMTILSSHHQKWYIELYAPAMIHSVLKLLLSIYLLSPPKVLYKARPIDGEETKRERNLLFLVSQ